MTWKISILGKNQYEKGKYKEKPLAVHQKSVFRLILGEKICILPNLKVEKPVYTDKISMSGRSAIAKHTHTHTPALWITQSKEGPTFWTSQAHITIQHKHTLKFNTSTHYNSTQAHITIHHKHTLLFTTSTHYYSPQAHITNHHKQTLVILFTTNTHYNSPQAHITIDHKHTLL